MHDNDPIKYMLCVKDLLTGIVLPWHLDTKQKETIQAMIVELEDAAHNRIEDVLLVKTLNTCITKMRELVNDSKSAKPTCEKFERARFMIVHIRNSLEKLLSQN